MIRDLLIPSDISLKGNNILTNSYPTIFNTYGWQNDLIDKPGGKWAIGRTILW